MNKRHFLAAGGTDAAGLWIAPATAAPSAEDQPALLTVTGSVSRSNRGPLDKGLDQMMEKHGVAFTKAFAFTSADLQRLPAQTISPTLVYDGKVHRVSGPLLTSVLQAAGARTGAGIQLTLRAVDGYNTTLSLAEVTATRMLVATHLDGQPLALGGLGPQWAVWDADRLPKIKDKPLSERFDACPWGLYVIEVVQG
jgi:hypothetical protein